MLITLPCCPCVPPACPPEISGPCWTIPLKPNELGDILNMLTQLRMMVANLSAQGQWLGGNSDRPVSRVKVSQGLRVLGLWGLDLVVRTLTWRLVLSRN